MNENLISLRNQSLQQFPEAAVLPELLKQRPARARLRPSGTPPNKLLSFTSIGNVCFNFIPIAQALCWIFHSITTRKKWELRHCRKCHMYLFNTQKKTFIFDFNKIISIEFKNYILSFVNILCVLAIKIRSKWFCFINALTGNCRTKTFHLFFIRVSVYVSCYVVPNTFEETLLSMMLSNCLILLSHI